MDERFMQPSSFNRPGPSPTFHHYHSPYSPNPTPYQQVRLTPYELFSKPPQPLDWMSSNQNYNDPSTQQAAPGLLNAFMDANGQVDFDKAMAVINQLASTYHQVSPIVRQVSSLIKGFR